MAEDTLKDLNYGHPGTAVYDIDSKEWSFVRQHTTKKLVRLRIWKVTEEVQPHALPASTECLHLPTLRNATSVQRHLKHIIRKHPQLAPNPELLSEPVAVSAAIQNTTSIYDPLVGCRLSFGFVTLEDRYQHPYRIAALPAGESGNILKLVVLTRERLNWGFDKNVRVDGPSLKDAECGYWNEEAVAIQQICFAQTEDPRSLLAIRLPSKLYFFRPLYHRSHQAAQQSPYYHLPPSLINACPLFHLTVENLGGNSLADVTFNPDYQLQFAVVDQNSTWSVWDIDHPRTKGNHKASCTLRGAITESDDLDITSEDGWARILWIGDINTVVVCNRRHLSIIDMKGGTLTYLPSPSLFSERSADWILDIKRHPRYKGHLFVLTSVHLVLVAVTTSSEALKFSTGEAGVHTLAAWRHYRGTEDITLQFSVQTISDDETCAILHSRLNDVVQLYFYKGSTSSLASASISDPSLLQLDIDEPGSTLEIYVKPMYMTQSNQKSYFPGPGKVYMEAGIQFYRIFVLRSDLSVQEFVVHTDSQPIQVEDFKRSVIRHRRLRVSRYDVVDEEDDDFIAPDGMTALAIPKSRIASQMLKRTNQHYEASELLYRDMDLMLDALTAMQSTASIDITVVTNQLQQILVDERHSDIWFGTLKDIVGSSIHLSDVDAASIELQRFCSLNNHENIVQIRQLASTAFLDLVEDEVPTISNIYDTILQTWIASLPSFVPARVRQHKERLARRIAAELLLAIYHLERNNTQAPMIGSQHDPIQIAIPVLPSKPGGRTHDDLDQRQQPHPLPTPPYSSMPSSSMPPSSPPIWTLQSPATESPADRMRRRLPNRDAAVPSIAITPNVHQLLAHWQVGTDPHTYDWDMTERALQPQELDDYSQQQREKERKRKERREKRQRREDELLASQIISQQPLVFPRSSPGPMLGGMGSSSQAQGHTSSQLPLAEGGFTQPGGFNSIVPQSQVEPGRFGGRPDKKKKKKTRISGF
ncbi:hypothetical protein ACN47E_009158 [Coniothyrium glycines]